MAFEKDINKTLREQRRRNMQAVRSSGSEIETILGKALFAKGLRYRKNDKIVFGKPDFTFKKYKVAVFVDSEFWHGKNWNKRKHDHKTNIDFWHTKIERNIKRDKEVNNKLRKDGWKVLRFWGKDIRENLEICVNQIISILNEAKRKNFN